MDLNQCRKWGGQVVDKETYVEHVQAARQGKRYKPNRGFWAAFGAFLQAYLTNLGGYCFCCGLINFMALLKRTEEEAVVGQ